MMTFNSNTAFFAYLLLAFHTLFNQAIATEEGIESFGVQTNGVRHVNASEADEILKRYPSVRVLDVRTGFEYNRGHLQDSVQINYYSRQFENKLDELDKNVTWLVHCRTGVRSGKTLPIMESLGFSSVIHLDGGIRAWSKGGFEVVKD